MDNNLLLEPVFQVGYFALSYGAVSILYLVFNLTAKNKYPVLWESFGKLKTFSIISPKTVRIFQVTQSFLLNVHMTLDDNESRTFARKMKIPFLLIVLNYFWASIYFLIGIIFIWPTLDAI